MASTLDDPLDGDNSKVSRSLEDFAHRSSNPHIIGIYHNDYVQVEGSADQLPTDRTYPLHQSEQALIDRIDGKTVWKAMLNVCEIKAIKDKTWWRRGQVLIAMLEGEDSPTVIASQLDSTTGIISGDKIALEKLGRKIFHGYSEVQKKLMGKDKLIFHRALRGMTIGQIADELGQPHDQVYKSLKVSIRTLFAVHVDEILGNKYVRVSLQEEG